MANLQYDKKQLPQIIGLGVLSAGLFGFFGYRMIAPPQVNAQSPSPGSPPSTATVTSPSATNASTDSSADDSDVISLIGAAPPTDAMRDPFAPPISAIAALSTPPASTPASPGKSPVIPGMPGIPGLPSAGEVTPLPAGPPDGGWTVYGIVSSDTDESNSVAIFRRADERKYIRLGGKVDDNIRLIGVDRNGVTVLHDNDRIRLPLGGVVQSQAKAVVDADGKVYSSAKQSEPSSSQTQPASVPPVAVKAPIAIQNSSVGSSPISASALSTTVPSGPPSGDSTQPNKAEGVHPF